mgnify:CR=1 FL=1
MEAIGFEVSPASSHNSIKKLKDKNQKQVNEELKDNWQKETDKRNEYFSKFGITILTFADGQLQNIDQCFEEMKSYLKLRKQDMSLDSELSKILNMDLDY